MSGRPVWAEVSRSKLLHNFALLRSLAASAELLAMVKGDAYGHGAEACSHVLVEAGAAWLAVTSVEEGVAVRAVCPEAEIVALSGLWLGDANLALVHGLTPVVWEMAHLEEAARPGAKMAVHLEVDTGMSRQGVPLAELPALLDRLKSLPNLWLDGVMTHFHSPEVLDSPANEEQFARFVTAVDSIFARGFRPRWVHAGNSTSLIFPGAAALVKLAEKHGAKAMLRPGLALYGYGPRWTGGTGPDFAEKLRPVLAWKTRVCSLRTIEPGEAAGYCGTFRAERRTRLALLPVGYADGLNRLLSSRKLPEHGGAALIRGRRVPIAGRVSMDLTIVDVTDVPGVEIGDEAVLIGAQGAEQITAYDQADLTGTIPYEILCNISARVPRVMVD
ncbi:MAG: alanine racemase [Acidobacteriaceae bacterium]